jgi:hypothetical protein
MPWSIKPIFGFSFDQIIKKIHKTKYVVYMCCIVKFFVYFLIVNLKIHWILFYMLNTIMVISGLYISIICEYLLVISTKKANEEL